jgi:hypothetical protein
MCGRSRPRHCPGGGRFRPPAAGFWSEAMPVKYKTPIHGQPFADILAELYAHAFRGAPGQSDPHTLSLAQRECIAYALAIYYQCEHCQVHHERAIKHAIDRASAAREEPCADAEALQDISHTWRRTILGTVLFTRVDSRNIGKEEWDEWKTDWHFFGRRPGVNANIANLTAFAIATARDDGQLLGLMRQTICATYPDAQVRLGVLRDVMRVVAFMKAATTINRVLPKYDRMLDCEEPQAAAEELPS